MTWNQGIARILVAAAATTASHAADLTKDLLTAVEKGQAAKVEALLAQGADPNAKDKKGSPALILAVKKDPHKQRDTRGVAEALLSRGADANATDALGQSALMLAAAGSEADAVRALLAKGANVNAKDRDDRTAAMVFLSDKLDAVRVLRAFAGLTYPGRSNDPKSAERSSPLRSTYGLQVRIEPSDRETLEQLVAAGAEAGAESKDHWTPLAAAALLGYADAVRSWLERGTDLNLRTQLGTPLMAAAGGGQHIIVETLLAKGADPNQTNADGDTALILACERGRTETVQILIDKGADATAKNRDGNTAYTAARRRNHEGVVTALTQAGIKE